MAAGAVIGPDAVLTRDVTVAGGARVRDSVVWEEPASASRPRCEERCVGAGVRVGVRALAGPGAVLGEGHAAHGFLADVVRGTR